MKVNKLVFPVIENKYVQIQNRLVPVGCTQCKEVVLYFDMEPVNNYERVPVLLATTPALTSYDTSLLVESLLGEGSL